MFAPKVCLAKEQFASLPDGFAVHTCLDIVRWTLYGMVPLVKGAGKGKILDS